MSWLFRASLHARSPPISANLGATSATRFQAVLRTVSHPRFNPTSKTQSRLFRTSNICKDRRQYQRFDGSRSSYKGQLPFFTLVQKWAARPTFKYEVAGLGAAASGYYVYNLEDVAVTGRRRFNVVSDESMEEMGKQQYSQIMQQYGEAVLPDLDPRVLQVKRVLDRLVPSSGLNPADWQIHVIQSEETNAFVIPGGKVFVFTGILPICRDDEGLAAVLGHEIAHNVAKHHAEKVSQSNLLAIAFMAMQYLLGLPDVASNLLLTLAFERPGSRTQESEADYIGVMMMAQSCYNPAAAVQFWHRMREAEKAHPAPPELLSTHPSSARREQKLQEWLPQAMDRYNASECGGIAGLAQDFKSYAKAPFM